MKNDKIKCVILKGEFSDMGNHILMPYGITLCGLPTVDADKKEFPQLENEIFSDMISEYDEVDFNTTCEKCIEIFNMLPRNQ